MLRVNRKMGRVSVSVAFLLAVMLKMHLIRNAIFQENELTALNCLLRSKLYTFLTSVVKHWHCSNKI